MSYARKCLVETSAILIGLGIISDKLQGGLGKAL